MPKIDPIQILLDEPVGDRRPDGADSAGLGFSEYADVLAGVILGSASPFTMGIYGDWGSGKTTLMQMIRERLMDYTPRERPGKEEKPTIVPVWFDAWRYEREEDLITPLLGEILDATQKHAVDPTVRSVGNAVSVLVRSALRGVSLKLPLWPEGPELEVTPEHFVEEYDRMVNELALPGSSEYRQAYRRLATQLRHLSQHKQASEKYGDNKFVVFVDDLDRCLPEAALQVLECTKVFLGFKGMVWVLGLKREIIENCIKERYRAKDAVKGKQDAEGDGKSADERHPYGEKIGSQYLQKIIQVPFTIPVGTAEEMALLPEHFAEGEKLPEELGKAFEEVAKPRTEHKGVYEEFDKRPNRPHFRQCYHVAAHYLEKKPRELKRLLNAYIVSSHITQAHLGGPDKHQPMLTLALLVLNFLKSKLYDHLTAPPDWDKQTLLLEEAARVLGVKASETKSRDQRKRATASYGRRPDDDKPEGSEMPPGQDPEEATEWLRGESGRKIAEFLLITRLLEADPDDIRAHARATSTAAALEESSRPSDETLFFAARAADARSDVRDWLAEALGFNYQNLTEQEQETVNELANDEAVRVRAGLARALGFNDQNLDEKGREIVSKLADDEAPEVRVRLA
ncbi:MAG: hypothetical protein J7M38_03905, partial [Armatimonadetes bacterium]|nr:hypothetical protein [Armatimonadota bacterium]